MVCNTEPPIKPVFKSCFQWKTFTANMMIWLETKTKMYPPVKCIMCDCLWSVWMCINILSGSWPLSFYISYLYHCFYSVLLHWKSLCILKSPLRKDSWVKTIPCNVPKVIFMHFIHYSYTYSYFKCVTVPIQIACLAAFSPNDTQMWQERDTMSYIHEESNGQKNLTMSTGRGK